MRPLGIDIEGLDGDAEATLVAVAPTYRPDLVREIDIVEEVGRRIGLDSIPRTLPHTTEQGGGLTPRQRARRLVADVLVGLGLCEAYTLPLIAESDVTRVGLSLDATVRATNALSAEEPILRPAILPGLLKSAAHNAGHGLTDLAFFELGHVFGPPPGRQLLPDERDHLVVLLTGTVGPGSDRAGSPGRRVRHDGRAARGRGRARASPVPTPRVRTTPGTVPAVPRRSWSTTP